MTYGFLQLIGLIVKQLGRPLTNHILEQGKQHYWFRKYILMPPAQAVHWCRVGVKTWVLNLGWPVKIPRLSEEEAVELGATLMTESILFSLALLVVYKQYQLHKARESKKMMMAEEETRAILESLTFLGVSTLEHNRLLTDTSVVLNRLGLSEKALGKALDPPSKKTGEELIHKAFLKKSKGSGGGPSKGNTPENETHRVGDDDSGPNSNNKEGGYTDSYGDENAINKITRDHTIAPKSGVRINILEDELKESAFLDDKNSASYSHSADMLTDGDEVQDDNDVQDYYELQRKSVGKIKGKKHQWKMQKA